MDLVAPLRRLQEAVERWLRESKQEMRLSTGTLRKYGAAVASYAELARARGVRSWSEADRPLALAYIGRVRDAGGSPATARVHLAAIRAFHAWLEEQGLGADPTRTIRSARRTQRMPATLTEAEVESILGLPAPGALGARDRAIVELAYSTGARSAEMTGLRLTSVSLEQGTVLVRGKGDRERTVLLTPQAVEALRLWLVARRRVAEPSQPWVFVNQSGRALSAMGLWKIIERRARAAGVERHVHPHMLRHSFATHLLQRGADVRAIQLMLGHTSIATTQAYLRVDDGWLRSVHQRFHPTNRKRPQGEDA